MLSQELKNHMKERSPEVLVGIAPPDDFNEQEVAAMQRMNAVMAHYSPMHTPDSPVFQPRDFLDNARAMVVLAFNFYFGRPELPGSPPRGEIMNFYVNPGCLAYIAAQTELVTGFLAERGYAAVQLATGISVKTIAARSGIGAYGKNGIIQTPELGSWIGIMLLITDAPLEPDTPRGDPCGACTLCRQACPTGALDTAYTCDIDKCITLHMVNNKGDLPEHIREKSGTCIAQCNVCVDVCPKNKKLAVQTAIDNPEELVYPEIAGLVNISQERYQQLFGDTFFDFMFMDKKYIQRNAAVALGNYGDPASIPYLRQALAADPEEIVRSHAAWALGKIGTAESKKVLKDHLSDPSAAVQAELARALKRL
jgi:epoxyqueuosine reductase QueG